jgi:hypothetical protein
MLADLHVLETIRDGITLKEDGTMYAGMDVTILVEPMKQLVQAQWDKYVQEHPDITDRIELTDARYWGTVTLYVTDKKKLPPKPVIEVEDEPDKTDI